MKANLIEVGGKMYTGPQLAKHAGVVSWSVAYMRLKLGWEVYEAFHTPLVVAERRDERDTRQQRLERLVVKYRAAIAWNTRRLESALRQLDKIDEKEGERLKRINAAAQMAEVDDV